jgi:hypothetical protein
MSDKKFSCRILRSGESHLFCSLAEMKLLFVAVISGEKCMFFYNFFCYENESK